MIAALNGTDPANFLGTIIILGTLVMVAAAVAGIWAEIEKRVKR